MQDGVAGSLEDYGGMNYSKGSMMRNGPSR